MERETRSERAVKAECSAVISGDYRGFWSLVGAVVVGR